MSNYPELIFLMASQIGVFLISSCCCHCYKCYHDTLLQIGFSYLSPAMSSFNPPREYYGIWISKWKGKQQKVEILNGCYDDIFFQLDILLYING